MVLYLDGAVYKGDWLGTEVESFHVGPELNRHDFVRTVFELDLGGGDPVVTSVELEKGNPQESPAGS